jgi:cold-inducible RNA-binding protein
MADDWPSRKAAVHRVSPVFLSVPIDLAARLADDAGRELKRKLRTGVACVPFGLRTELALPLQPRLVEPFRHWPRSLFVKKLYVGNLPFQATEEDLGNWFSQVGVSPANITLVRDRFSGQPRGFGFVEVNNDDDAGRAIQALNGHDFMGRSVVVNEARPPREGGGGGGGGRGAGGGGRGGYGGGRGGRGGPGGGGGGRGRY